MEAQDGSTGAWSPLVMTTELCTAHAGPLGALGRALSVVRRCRLTPGCPRVDRAWFQRLKLDYDRPLSTFAFNLNLRRYTVAGLRGGHRLGGVQESDHDFPLNASNVSLLALGILHQVGSGG